MILKTSSIKIVIFWEKFKKKKKYKLESGGFVTENEKNLLNYAYANDDTLAKMWEFVFCNFYYLFSVIFFLLFFSATLIFISYT